MSKSQVRVDAYFERQRTSSRVLEDPESLIVMIARCVVEALAGARNLDQVARWLSDDVYRNLRMRVEIADRARINTGRPARRPFIATGDVHITEPVDGVIESVVVVRTAARARAVAVRLEGWDSRWRATTVAVL